jgi:hypothetical protein
VLIDSADQPRITDFGLAKFMEHDSRVTQSGVVMGTPSYMPPEQAAGRHGDIGPASDVYSLGAMLYELLTGRPPFRASTPMATLLEVLEAEPIAPRRLKPDIPMDLETICLKCLEKSPTARYPTSRALAEELVRFLEGEPIQARPASVVRKTVSWARRHPGILVALAAFFMVALSFGVFYLLEENAFLRAQQADPTLARVSGAHHEALGVWILINCFANIYGFYLFLILRGRARGLSLRESLNPEKHSGPTQPLDGRTRNVAIGLGLVFIGCGVMLEVTVIQACVWEAESLFNLFLSPIFAIVGSISLGLATLGLVVQDYRLVHYGLPSTPIRQPTAEGIEPIRRALEDQDLPAEQIALICRDLEDHNLLAAVVRYRKAVPQASLREAVRLLRGQTARQA